MTRGQAQLSRIWGVMRPILASLSSILKGESMEKVLRGENDFSVFISSVMDKELSAARRTVVKAIDSIDFGRPWAFEYTPASSETMEDGYLRKVKEADFVIWLVGSTTTEPVANEVNECLANEGRLLVFKLPPEKKDCKTKELLKRVGSRIKWQEVNDLSELRQHIKLAISDEVVRAIRDPAPPFRSKRLKDSLDYSVSSCKAAWTALGVPEDLADDLAKDSAVGCVSDIPETGFYTIEADQGAGKTLAAHRLYQLAIRRALTESSAPYPIFLDARELQGSLRSHIELECKGYADPITQGVFLIVDGIDEADSGKAKQLQEQVAAICDISPNSTVIMCTRPIPQFTSGGKGIPVPTLTEEEVVDLIRRISGHDMEIRHLQGWPNSMKEVAKYPLFAIMIGARLRDNPDYAFSSRNQLIEELALEALGEAEDYSEELDRLLHRLATLSVSDGKRIRLLDLDRKLANQNLVTRSRIVTESSGTVDFTLPIFREWYAARAVLEGTTEVGEIQLASDRWLIPLSIVLNSGDEQVVQDLMVHLVTSDPGFASLLLRVHRREHESRYRENQERVSSLESAIDAGKEILGAMGAWKQGLGRLFLDMGPVKSDGEMKSLGVGINDRYVITRWYGEDESENPIVVIPEEELHDRSPKWSIYGMEVPNAVGWSWVATRERLRHDLSRGFNRLNVASTSEDTLRELTWDVSLGLTGESAFTCRELKIEDILVPIEQQLTHDWELCRIDDESYSRVEVEAVRSYLLSLRTDGESTFGAVWPLPDKCVSSGLIWNFYSEQQLLDRTNAIYSAALRIYAAMVEKWFVGFAPRLPLYSMLPVFLEGWVTTHDPEEGRNLGPSLYYRPRISLDNEQSEARFEQGTGQSWNFDKANQYFDEEEAKFTQLRTGHSADMQPTFISTGILDEVADMRRPATKLARTWLRRELSRLDWM